MPDPAQAQQQMCGDGYPFPYTTAQGFAGERRCELQPGHDGYHLWQQCQWPPAQQQDAAAMTLVEALSRVESMPDQIEALTTEVERLQSQLAKAQAERGEERRNASRLFDELRAENEAARESMRDALQFLTHGVGSDGLTSAESDGGAYDAAETLKVALARLDEQPSAPPTTD